MYNICRGRFGRSARGGFWLCLPCLSAEFWAGRWCKEFRAVWFFEVRWKVAEHAVNQTFLDRARDLRAVESAIAILRILLGVLACGATLKWSPCYLIGS